MSWDKGFDFRATSGFVTDPANCTWVLAETYPVTRNGVTFGWADAITGNSRDRSSSVDARLAGINFCQTAKRFQVDLPASGSYTIRLAMGDDTAQFNTCEVIFKDSTTVLATIGSNSTIVSAAHFLDASNVDRTAAAWPGSNATIQKTFATTTFIALLGGNADTNPLAHIFLSQVVVVTGKLFSVSQLAGLGSGGPFFQNPLN